MSPIDTASPHDRRRTVFATVGAVVVLALDQASKALVRAWLPLHEPREVIPGVFYLRHALNDGAAWGVLAGRQWLLVLVSVAMLAILWWNRRDLAASRLSLEAKARYLAKFRDRLRAIAQ